MSGGTDDTKLAVLPFHILARSRSEAVLTRGTTAFEVRGPDIVALLRALCDRLSAGGSSRAELIAAISGHSRSTAADLVDLMIERRLLVDQRLCERFAGGLESPIDLFHWQFGLEALRPDDDYRATRVAVVGVNPIGITLKAALAESGFDAVDLVDDPFLRRDPAADAEAMDAAAWIGETLPATDIVVACSDSGSETIVREWNALCVRNGVRFFPVLLRGMAGFVGPLVLPGETACFECKVRREHGGPAMPTDVEEAIEVEAARGSVAAYHPSMAAVLAHYAAVELVKFYGYIPVFSAGIVFDINLLRPELVARRVLKLPTCPVCSPLNVTPTASIVDLAKLELE